MIKYVNYGNPRHGVHIFVITMFRTEHGSYKVEIKPCDTYGYAVSDTVAWDMFPDWWSARKYMRKQYKEFDNYVNHIR